MLKTADMDKYRDYYSLFLCAPRTGIRQGVLIALKGIDLDFNGRFIHVQRHLSRGKISLPKNGNDRKVDMAAKLCAVVSELLSKRRAASRKKCRNRPTSEGTGML